MFASGMNQYLQVPFMVQHTACGGAYRVKFFSWIATIWKGKIQMPTPMLFVLEAS